MIGGAMWRIPEAAPKTGEMILADLGWPWPCLACWNKAESKWVYASLQIGWFLAIEDPYFETEYSNEKTLKRWMPLPELPKKEKS